MGQETTALINHGVTEKTYAKQIHTCVKHKMYQANRTSDTSIEQ